MNNCRKAYNHSWRRPRYFRLLVPNRVNRRGVDQKKKYWNLLLFFAGIKRDGHFIPLSERREYKRKTLIGRGLSEIQEGGCLEGWGHGHSLTHARLPTTSNAHRRNGDDTLSEKGKDRCGVEY